VSTPSHNRPDQAQFSAAERDRLKAAYPGTHDAGARWSFLREFPADADRDGYPATFRRWPREKRAAWLVGASVGFHDRLRFAAETEPGAP
jgi:hypothetical protein